MRLDSSGLGTYFQWLFLSNQGLPIQSADPSKPQFFTHVAIPWTSSFELDGLATLTQLDEQV
jgi:hypothetical protein